MAEADDKPFKQIILIDDNRTFSSLMRSVLWEFGFRDIIDFENPDDAIEMMKTTFVDVCFLDLMMPGTNGFRVADRIRHNSELRNRMLPIIMVTGHADRTNIQRAINHGIDEVLVKPIRPKFVYQRLMGVLEKPRVYIKTRSGYFGPDRRRRKDPNYIGPERRKVDDHEVLTSTGFVHVREHLAAQRPVAVPAPVPVVPQVPVPAPVAVLKPAPASQPDADVFLLD
ncbi:response regulator [Methylobrevis pamukkalensis]|uniref:Response regulatory domain-containing protein n=1 Tax=Methylobrevis pamukkalensis TaxID=1439726 RepID=A0A1E3H699_9HYPH|nr:response regulator [Methylobrevis pamukkalensis]ODN71840.1 hypothetical protein A6302_00772 [Methylobrevis pamukkalensis]